MNKRIMKVITLILSCLLLIGAAVGITAAADEVNNAPSVTIERKNIAYEGAIQIVYLVKATALPEGAVPAIKFEATDKDAYVKTAAGTITLSGTKYDSIYSNGIVAKEYRLGLKATPGYLVGETFKEAGDEVNFTAYDYAMARFDATPSAAQFELYKALLDYGAAVQTVLNYNDETVKTIGGWIDEYYNTTITNQATGKVVEYKRGKTAPDTNYVVDRLVDGKVFLGLYENDSLAVANAGWYKYTVKPGSAKKNIVAKFADGTNPYDQFKTVTENPDILSYSTGSFIADASSASGRYVTGDDGSLLFVKDSTAENFLQVYFDRKNAQATKVVYDFDINVESATDLRNQFIYLKYYATNSASEEAPYTSASLSFDDGDESDEYYKIANFVVKYGEWQNLRLEFVKVEGEYGFRVYEFVNGEAVLHEVKEGTEVVDTVDFLKIDAHSAPYFLMETRWVSSSAASNVTYRIDNYRACELTACDAHEYAELNEAFYLVSAANCKTGTTYKTSCKFCGLAGSDTYALDDKIDHSYSEVTCTTKPTCTVCGYVNETVETLPHNYAKVPYAYAINTQATDNSPATYYESCTVCKGVNEEVTFVFGKTEPYFGGNGTPVANGLNVSKFDTDTSADLGYFLFEDDGNYFVRYHDDSTTQSSHGFYNATGVTDASVYYYQFDIRIDGFTDVRGGNWPVTLKLMGVKKDANTNTVSEVNNRAFDIFAREGDTHAAFASGGNQNAADNYKFGTWATLTFKLEKGEADGDAFKWTVTMYVDGVQVATSSATSKVVPEVRMEPRHSYQTEIYKNACNIDYDNIITYYEHTCNEAATIKGDAYLISAGDCYNKAVYMKSCSICGAGSSSATFEGEISHSDYIEQVDEKYLVSPADCKNAALYKKSCETCGAAHATETFYYGETADHVYINHNSVANLKEAATATTPAIYWVKCKGCNVSNYETFTDGALIHDYSDGKVPSYYGGALTNSGATGAYRIIMEDNGNKFFRLGKDATSTGENVVYWTVPTGDYVLSNSLWFDFKWNGGTIPASGDTVAGYVKVYAADEKSGYKHTDLKSTATGADLTMFDTTFKKDGWYRINVQFNYNDAGGTSVLVDVYNAAGELVKDNFNLGTVTVRTAKFTIHPRNTWTNISFDYDNAYLVTEHICQNSAPEVADITKFLGETSEGSEFLKVCGVCGTALPEAATINTGVYTVGVKPAIPSMTMTGAAAVAPETDANEDGIADGAYWLAQSETVTNVKGAEVENTFLRYFKNKAGGGVQWKFAPTREDGKDTYVVEFDFRWQGAQSLANPETEDGRKCLYNFAVGGKKGYYGTATKDGNGITLHGVAMNKGDWHKITYTYVWNEANENYAITIQVDGVTKGTNTGTSIGLAWEMRSSAAFAFMFDIDNFTYTAK